MISLRFYWNHEAEQRHRPTSYLDHEYVQHRLYLSNVAGQPLLTAHPNKRLLTLMHPSIIVEALAIHVAPVRRESLKDAP